jgi:putative ABC transport system permease protein
MSKRDEELLPGMREEPTQREALWSSLRQDVGYALRSLRRSPGFILAAVLTLGLGIGANTAVFTVAEGVLLRPPPFPEPERIVRVYTQFSSFKRAHVSRPEVEDFRKARDTFTHLGAYTLELFTVTAAESEPERLIGLRVEPSWFDVLGLRPHTGRMFLTEEGTEGQDQVVVLSHGLWRRLYGGRPEAIGGTLQVNDVSRTIVGVLPEDFEFRDAELIIPKVLGPVDPFQRGNHNMSALARLAPGVSVEQGQTVVSAIARQLVATYPDPYPASLNFNAVLVPLHEDWVGNVRTPLLLLLGAVLLVQLIACANVANLLLARGEVRQHELAVRTALGASRGRLVRQLLTESLVLGLAGGLLGLLLALLGVDALIAAAAGSLPRASQVQVNLSALSVALGVALASGLVFGLLPAVQATRSDPLQALQLGGRGYTAGARRLRTRNVLVVVEVALAVMLVTSAGLLLRSFWELRQVDPGYDAERVLTLNVSVPNTRYATGARVASFYRQLIERLSGLPGVEAAALTSTLPMGRGGWSKLDVDVEGRIRAPGEARPSGFYYAVTPDYFRTLGIPVLKGRDFRLEDDNGRVEVALVNESMARLLWPGEDPLGKRFRLGGFPNPEDPFPWVRVVGVVADTRSESLEAGTRPEYYMLHGSLAEARDLTQRSVTVLLRTRVAPLSLAGPARSAVRELDPGLAVANVQTLEQVTLQTAARTRFTALLLTLFGGAGLVLAAVGIYGVLSFMVAQRTREMGIRMALGESRWSVLRLVVGQGLRLTAIGVALGVGAAISLAELLQSMLYGISSTDPLTYVAVVAVLGGVALLASYLPARRATAVEPVTALRSE